LGTLSLTQSIRAYNGNLLLIPKPKLQERAHHCSCFTVQKLQSVKELNGRVFVRYREESDKSHPWGTSARDYKNLQGAVVPRDYSQSALVTTTVPYNRELPSVSSTLIFIYGFICSAAELR